MRLPFVRYPRGACTLICLLLLSQVARAQSFRYEAEPRAGGAGFAFADADPAPRMNRPVAPAVVRAPYQAAPAPRVLPSAAPVANARPVATPQPGRRDVGMAPRPRVTQEGRFLQRTSASEPIPAGRPLDPFGEELPYGGPPSGDDGYRPYRDSGAPLEPQVMGEPFYQGTEPYYMDGGYLGDEYYSGADCYDGNCYGGDCLLRRWWRHVNCLRRNGAYSENFSLFTGKQGFKGPVDQGVNGDFGYHGGGTWGLPLLEAYGIGYQIGVNYIGSDFAGRTGPLGHRRAQLFATTGVYRRAECGYGFQGGAVVDYVRDDFYIQMDLTQARAELSYLYNYHELGFWGAFQGNTSTHWGQIPNQPWQEYSFQANSQYNLFYRYEFANGTFARTWAGLSAHGDGIFGGDATVRFSEKVGLVANYNYLLPRNDSSVPNNVKESWNLTISFVWFPGYNRCDSWKNPYRPLFYTADNGWFLTRQNYNSTN